jgi:hypothetical protein
MEYPEMPCKEQAYAERERGAKGTGLCFGWVGPHICVLVGVCTSTDGPGMQRASVKDDRGKQWREVEVEVELVVLSRRVQP